MSRLLEWRNVLVLGLAVAILITISVVRQSWQPRPATPITPLSDAGRQVDSFLQQTQIRSFDAEGELIQAMEADEVTHYSDNSWRLKTVRLTRLPGPWTLRANEGYAPPGLGELELRGEVVVNTVIDLETPATLFTDAMRVHLDQRWLESLAPVRVESARAAAQADLLKASLESADIELEGNVRVRHEP